MVALAGEIGDGMVFANAARSHMPASLGALPAAKASDPNFFIGDMIPTCISDDEAAAAAVNRKTLLGYVSLPNYRNYWREAGYVDEMNAIEKAITARNFDEVPKLISDRWLSDVTLYGSVRRCAKGSRPGTTQAFAHRSWCRRRPSATRSRRSRRCSPASLEGPGAAKRPSSLAWWLRCAPCEQPTRPCRSRWPLHREDPGPPRPAVGRSRAGTTTPPAAAALARHGEALADGEHGAEARALALPPAALVVA
jgi:hypothetical protein